MGAAVRVWWVLRGGPATAAAALALAASSVGAAAADT